MGQVAVAEVVVVGGKGAVVVVAEAAGGVAGGVPSVVVVVDCCGVERRGRGHMAGAMGQGSDGVAPWTGMATGWGRVENGEKFTRCRGVS